MLDIRVDATTQHPSGILRTCASVNLAMPHIMRAP